MYIDNNPSKGAVLRDLNDWWPLLVPGGFMAGSRFMLAGVRAAVLEFC